METLIIPRAQFTSEQILFLTHFFPTETRFLSHTDSESINKAFGLKDKTKHELMGIANSVSDFANRHYMALKRRRQRRAADLYFYKAFPILNEAIRVELKAKGFNN